MTDTTPDMIRRHHAEMELVKARHAVEVTRLREALQEASVMLRGARGAVLLAPANAEILDAVIAQVKAALTLPAPDVELILKDHRAMEVLRRTPELLNAVTSNMGTFSSSFEVWIGDGEEFTAYSDPADAILALEDKK